MEEVSRGADTVAMAALGASEVESTEITVIERAMKAQPTLIGFNVFFYLPQDGITCQPTDVFFYFLSLKSEKLRKRFYFSD